MACDQCRLCVLQIAVLEDNDSVKLEQIIPPHPTSFLNTVIVVFVLGQPTLVAPQLLVTGVTHSCGK